MFKDLHRLPISVHGVGLVKAKRFQFQGTYRENMYQPLDMVEKFCFCCYGGR